MARSVPAFLFGREIHGRRKINKSDSIDGVNSILEARAADPEKNEAFKLPGQTRSTFLMDFSPDGKKVASTHGDHTVRITDIATGVCVATLTGHPRTPWCLAFHPTANDVVASGCLGGQIRIWDIYRGCSEMWQSPGATVIASLAFHPTERLLVFATSNRIYFWDWLLDEPFTYCQTANKFERTRWVRFDNTGHRLFTGIANTATIQPVETVPVRPPSRYPSEVGSARRDELRSHYRSLLDRYNTYEQEYIAAGLHPNSNNSIVDTLRVPSPTNDNIRFTGQLRLHPDSRRRPGVSWLPNRSATSPNNPDDSRSFLPRPFSRRQQRTRLRSMINAEGRLTPNNLDQLVGLMDTNDPDLAIQLDSTNQDSAGNTSIRSSESLPSSEIQTAYMDFTNEPENTHDLELVSIEQLVNTFTEPIDLHLTQPVSDSSGPHSNHAALQPTSVISHTEPQSFYQNLIPHNQSNVDSTDNVMSSISDATSQLPQTSNIHGYPEVQDQPTSSNPRVPIASQILDSNVSMGSDSSGPLDPHITNEFNVNVPLDCEPDIPAFTTAAEVTASTLPGGSLSSQNSTISGREADYEYTPVSRYDHQDVANADGIEHRILTLENVNVPIAITTENEYNGSFMEYSQSRTLRNHNDANNNRPAESSRDIASTPDSASDFELNPTTENSTVAHMGSYPNFLTRNRSSLSMASQGVSSSQINSIAQTTNQASSSHVAHGLVPIREIWQSLIDVRVELLEARTELLAFYRGQQTDSTAETRPSVPTTLRQGASGNRNHDVTSLRTARQVLHRAREYATQFNRHDHLRGRAQVISNSAAGQRQSVFTRQSHPPGSRSPPPRSASPTRAPFGSNTNWTWHELFASGSTSSNPTRQRYLNIPDSTEDRFVSSLSELNSSLAHGSQTSVETNLIDSLPQSESLVADPNTVDSVSFRETESSNSNISNSHSSNLFYNAGVLDDASSERNASMSYAFSDTQNVNPVRNQRDRDCRSLATPYFSAVNATTVAPVLSSESLPTTVSEHGYSFPRQSMLNVSREVQSLSSGSAERYRRLDDVFSRRASTIRQRLHQVQRHSQTRRNLSRHSARLRRFWQNFAIRSGNDDNSDRSNDRNIMGVRDGQTLSHNNDASSDDFTDLLREPNLTLSQTLESVRNLDRRLAELQDSLNVTRGSSTMDSSSEMYDPFDEDVDTSRQAYPELYRMLYSEEGDSDSVDVRSSLDSGLLSLGEVNNRYDNDESSLMSGDTQNIDLMERLASSVERGYVPYDNNGHLDHLWRQRRHDFRNEVRESTVTSRGEGMSSNYNSFVVQRVDRQVSDNTLEGHESGMMRRDRGPMQRRHLMYRESDVLVDTPRSLRRQAETEVLSRLRYDHLNTTRQRTSHSRRYLERCDRESAMDSDAVRLRRIMNDGIERAESRNARFRESIRSLNLSQRQQQDRVEIRRMMRDMAQEISSVSHQMIVISERSEDAPINELVANARSAIDSSGRILRSSEQLRQRIARELRGDSVPTITITRAADHPGDAPANDETSTSHAAADALSYPEPSRPQHLPPQAYLPQPYLHPHYADSILDDGINRPTDALQFAINRTIAGAFIGTGEAAVASNINNLTHRIQMWDFSKFVIPDITLVTTNIVVPHCKLHNDASVEISQDSSLLVTFVPSHRGFPDGTVLAVFSLRPESFGQCLHTQTFGPNVVSVSISPLNNYIVVGLASRRITWVYAINQMVAQIYKLTDPMAGEFSMKHVSNIHHPYEATLRTPVSLNSARWIPQLGHGLVYGTNRGTLHICRPGSIVITRKAHKVNDADDDDDYEVGNLSSFLSTHRLRRTAGTQTDSPVNSFGSPFISGLLL